MKGGISMNPADERFVRKFCVNPRMTWKLPLGGMDCHLDFTTTERGTPYPVIVSSGKYSETVCDGRYRFHGESSDAAVSRLLGHLMPLATYSLAITELDGAVGFVWLHGRSAAYVCLVADANGCLSLVGHDGEGNEERIPTEYTFRPGIRLLAVPARGRVDVYLDRDGFPAFLHTFSFPVLDDVMRETFFMETQACVFMSGTVTVSGAEVCMDSGLAQADIRPIRWETGEPLTENGHVWFTLTIRQQQGGYQGIVSWIPGTSEFALTGALFFDVGDGIWGNDVATSLLYDRNAKQWRLWYCSFTHGHILGHASFAADPRCGVSVIDTTLVPMLTPEDPDTAFGGKSGDEDPDFYYDASTGMWTMAVCRVCRENGKYRYFFFRSADPFDGYEFFRSGALGSETGGSFVLSGDQRYFVCGNGFDRMSDYRVYDMETDEPPRALSADFPDGGFRGWGTLVPVPMGTRKKLYWLTFDRKLSSTNNWSYGNLYCFEAER